MIYLDNVAVFVRVVELGTLSAAGRDLRISPAVASHRIKELEKHLGVRLFNRSTRRLSLTAEGEVYLESARRILGEIEDLDELIASRQASPRGLLKVNAPLGFGRSYIAPAIAEFAAKYPEVSLHLQLTDSPADFVQDAFDVAVRFGDLPDTLSLIHI